MLLVTVGVALTTLSSIESKPRSPNASLTASSSESQINYMKYATGIGILTVALVLSGFLGLSQDSTFATYGRGHWEEAMFYLHALALPMFSFVGTDLTAQIRAANAGPVVEFGAHTVLDPLSLFSITTNNDTRSTVFSSTSLPPLPYLPIRPPTLLIPSFYIPLVLNVLTQLLCVSGVNRLTSRVNSLTVTLILVVRKAVSLAISVLLLRGSKGNAWLWVGALAVLAGTVGYTLGSRKSPKKDE